MILTDRELFLLIICTVFYITLFIVVLQSNRRKMQLLQSRLDNIHAMQKIAVMEQRTHAQDVNDIFSSDVYQRIKQYLADGKNMHLHRIYRQVVQPLSHERARLSRQSAHQDTHATQGYCHADGTFEGEHCLDAQPTLPKGFRSQGFDKRLGRFCTVYIK